tara:strand:- start:403 stop:594 length:192 start_codon:yes stop_codon:yes gene_type:complete
VAGVYQETPTLNKKQRSKDVYKNVCPILLSWRIIDLREVRCQSPVAISLHKSVYDATNSEPLE